MKSNKTNKFLGVLFALALSLNVGMAISRNKVNQPAEIVYAEEETEETPINEEETPINEEETPVVEDEEISAEPVQESQPAEKEEEKSSTTTGFTKRDGLTILKIIFKTFRDALLDLKNHITNWLRK